MEGNSDKDDGTDSDDSSIGETGYESPEMSDSEGSSDEDMKDAISRKRKIDDDDLFKYEAKKFHKQSDTIKQQISAPSSNRKSATNNKTVENKTKLLRLERLKQRKKQAARLKRDDILDDSDTDDSDLEISCSIVGESKRKGKEESSNDSKRFNPKDTVVVSCRSGGLANKRPHKSAGNTTAIELLSSGESSPDSSPVASKMKVILDKATTVAAGRPTSSSAAATVYCLSSDDDSDAEGASPPNRAVNLPPALAAQLEQAQQAKARLEKAQEYHAHDVHVAVQEPVAVPTTQTRAIRSTPRSSANNNRCPSGTGMGKILNFTCRCGHIIINGIKEALAKDKQSTVLIVRENEPLSALVERFCRAQSLPHENAKVSMVFDGRKLDTTKTPAFYEMEDEDLIDVSASSTRRLTGQKSGSLGKSLRFSCRTQIKVVSNSSVPNQIGRRPKRQKQQPQQPSKSEMVTKTVVICENQHLGIIAKRLCAALGDLPLATTKVVMRFDGRVLDTEKMPTFYEMEDEDMVEVTIEKQEQHQINDGSSCLPLQKGGPSVGNDTGNSSRGTSLSQTLLSTFMIGNQTANNNNNGDAANITRATRRQISRTNSKVIATQAAGSGRVTRSSSRKRTIDV